MAADTLGLYPQATPKGDSIPFEVIRPLGFLKQAFTSAAVNGVVIPAAADLLVLRADQDCLVQLGGNAVVPANGVHTLNLVFVGQGECVVIDHNAAATFGVIRLTADGTLTVQTLAKYRDVRKNISMTRN